MKYFEFFLGSFMITTKTTIRSLNETCFRSDCFSHRDYVAENEVTGLPLLLLSYPGSGNTLTRLLIEYATGIYTGSIYTDGNLAEVLPGERFCGIRLAAIKAHPGHVFVANNSVGQTILSFQNKDIKRKCKKGLIFEFSRVIILLRDPYHAIWADYQRDHTGLLHDRGIMVNEFDRDNWEKSALSNIKNLANLWNDIYIKIFQFFPSWNVHVVRYEDLTNNTHANVQYDTLRGIIQFMQYTINESRLRCAFDLAESPNVQSIHRVINTTSMVTIDQVYSSNELVWSMWNIIKNQTNLYEYGYQPYRKLAY